MAVMTWFHAEQESLANAKVSARQPWYIRRNSLNRPHLGSPSKTNVIYTSLKSTFSAQQFPHWQCGSIFIRLAVQTCQLAQNSEKIWTHSSSRSSKLDDFGADRKRIFDVLLVINSNYLAPFLRYGDLLAENRVIFLPLCHLAPPLPTFPMEFHVEVKRQETRFMGLLCGEGCVILTSIVFDWSTRVADRRTDGRWHIARYSIYAVAR